MSCFSCFGHRPRSLYPTSEKIGSIKTSMGTRWASLSLASGVKGNNPSTLAPRPDYREVTLPKDKKLVGTDPKQIARSVFGNSESGEGNFHEEVLLIEKTDKKALVTLTQTGLPDDSVEGMRYRLEFIREGNQWRLTWAGRQVRCYAGRGTNAWTKGSCS
jgi:hypothetical protein